MVGAPGAYVEGVSGLIVLYEGGESGLTELASYAQEQTDGGQYGLSITAADTNNDSSQEIFVGMPHFTGHLPYQGAIFKVEHNSPPQQELTTRTIQYTYDPLYRLTSASYSTGEEFAYSYDVVGNRLAMTDSSGTTTYTYDASNRLEDVNGTTYTYDANGNLLDDGSSTYTYDALGSLTSTTDGTSTSTYLYDGLGNRLAQTTDGTTTEYALDVAGGLPEVIAATTNGNTTRYLQVGGQLLAQHSSGAWQYILPDHLGSVRQVVDANWNLIQSTSYTPFGEVMESEGVGASAFGFTGEQRDATGLLYLRARYYEPERGAFLSRDAFAGWAEQPYSQHPYQYGYSNPLRYTDPTGHFVCGTKDKPCPKNPWPFEPIPLGTGCQVLDVIGKFTLNLGCQMIGGVCKVEGNFLVEASNEEYLQAQIDSVLALATPIKYPTNQEGWIKAFTEVGIEDTSEALKAKNFRIALNNALFFKKRGIKITGHALRRMQERGISEKQVLELYKGEVTRTFYKGTNLDRYTIVNQGFNVGIVVDDIGQIISVLGNKNQIRTAYQYTSSLLVFDLPETLRKILH